MTDSNMSSAKGLRIYDIEQPYISIAEHYTIRSAGLPEIYAHRPKNILRVLLALFCGALAFLILGALLAMASVAVNIPTGFAFSSLAAFTFVFMFFLWPRRNISFYADKDHKQKLWSIREDRPLLLEFLRKFTILVPGLPPAVVRLKIKSKGFGTVWQLSPEAGPAVFWAERHSRSLIRSTAAGRGFRALDFNFIIPTATGSELLADFNRQPTLNDTYQLRIYRNDQVEERWIVSMAILLDTGLNR